MRISRRIGAPLNCMHFCEARRARVRAPYERAGAAGLARGRNPAPSPRLGTVLRARRPNTETATRLHVVDSNDRSARIGSAHRAEMTQHRDDLRPNKRLTSVAPGGQHDGKRDSGAQPAAHTLSVTRRHVGDIRSRSGPISGDQRLASRSSNSACSINSTTRLRLARSMGAPSTRLRGASRISVSENSVASKRCSPATNRKAG